MFTIEVAITGLDETVAFLERLEVALSGPMRVPLNFARQEIQDDIGKLFDNRAAGKPEPWDDWRPTTKKLRNKPPAGHYYGLYPGPVDDVVGVWTGAMRMSFMTSMGPCFAEIGDRYLRMGMTGVVEKTFATGRKSSPVQEARPIYENLYLDNDDLTNPIIRAFDGWITELVESSGGTVVSGALANV